jgi:hypothetical protein
MTIKKPIILEQDGVLSQLADGDLINAGGTASSTFTVGGKGLLFDDGSSTSPGGLQGITLQNAYDNSSTAGQPAVIRLASGRNLQITNSDSSISFLLVNAATGDITVGGNIVTSGLVDGVDVSVLKTLVDKHLDGTGQRHLAIDVDIIPISSLPGSVSNVQEALEYLATNSPSGLLTEINAVEAAIGPSINANGTFNASGFTNVTDVLNNPTSVTDAIQQVANAFTAQSGTGNVKGPTTASTDNAIVRFDGTTGKLIQNSLVTVSDTGAFTAPSVGSVIPFFFADQAAFPSATTYRGAIVLSNSDGRMYFAHGGSWNAVAKLSDVPSDLFVNTIGDTMTGNLTFSSGAKVTGLPTPTNTSDATPKSYVDDNFVNAAGDTMAGNLAFAGGAKITGLPAPTSNGDAATKQYVDDNFVNTTGDTMAGSLTFTGGAKVTGLPTPLTDSDAANKQYVDDNFVNVAGDTVTGNLTFAGGAKVTGLPTPIVNGDAANKAYVDAEATARANADATLQAAINAEITARIAGDTSVQSAVNAEITARASADATLQAAINAEITARTSADTTLQNNLNAEATARAAADATLQAAIDAEVSARSALSQYADDTFLKKSGGTVTGALVIGSGGSLTGVPTPVNDTDAANKAYVDSILVGLSWKDSVRAATTANINLATAAQNGSVLDDVTLATGDRILVKDQTTKSQNGIYVVNATGAPTRASDLSLANEFDAAAVLVREGSANQSTAWTQTETVTTVGTSNVVWVQFGKSTTVGTDISLGSPVTGDMTGAVELLTSTTVSDGIAQLNEVLAKLVPAAPPNFPGSYTLAVQSFSGSYRMADFTQTDNTATGSKTVAGGTTVSTVRRAASYTTNTVQNVGPGNKGTVTARVNGVAAGAVTLTSALTGAGTYNNLVISNNVDYNTVDSTKAAGFWSVFTAGAAGNVSTGWNEVDITDSVAGSTNKAAWYYDSSAPGTPTFTSTSITPPASPTLVYSSTIPHYSSANTFTVSFNANRLSGDMYPTSDTFMTGTAGGAFDAPASRTYSQAGITTPLARNLYVSSGSAAVSTTSNIIAGFGSSSTGPSVSVSNSYSTGTAAISPSGTVLYKTGTSSSMEETSVQVGSTIGSGSTAVARIVNSGSADTPAFTASAALFNSQSSTLLASDATIVAAVLKHDQTNYSTGYLPAGPNLSSGRSGSQYFTFKIVRTSVSKFDIRWTGTLAGLWVAVPGSTIDSSSGLSGWLDASVAYAGSGIPGSNTGAGGNGSNGCALGTVAPLNSAQTNRSITITFGTVSSSSTATNEIYVRIKLTSGQSITALSLQTASN